MVLWSHCYDMKMEAADSSKTLAPIYQTSRHHSTDNCSIKYYVCL